LCSAAYRLPISDDGGAVAGETTLDKRRDALLVDCDGVVVRTEGGVVGERAVALPMQAEHGQVVHGLQGTFRDNAGTFREH
jgi:hypothetical protein